MKEEKGVGDGRARVQREERESVCEFTNGSQDDDDGEDGDADSEERLTHSIVSLSNDDEEGVAFLKEQHLSASAAINVQHHRGMDFVRTSEVNWASTPW